MSANSRGHSREPLANTCDLPSEILPQWPDNSIAPFLNSDWSVLEQAELADEPRAGRPRWESRYAALVVGADLLVLSLVLGTGAAIGLGDSTYNRHNAQILALVVLGGFICAMAACRAWEPRILGSGAEEFTRLLRGVVSSAVVLGLCGLAFNLQSTRPWVFLMIPAVGALTAMLRLSLRHRLHRRRSRGECTRRVLAVGGDDAVGDLIARTQRAFHHGWSVAGVCVPAGLNGAAGDHVRGVPVVGDLDSVNTVVDRGDFHVVAVAPADGWSSTRLHRLSWDLEGRGIDLVVHPGLMEVTGPRLHVAPVDGLPLLRLTEPAFTGIPRLVKATVDRIGAALLLLLLAPLLLVVFVAIRTDGGPAFFRQARVGRNGSTFSMLKFRSMVVDAEQLRTMLEPTNDGSGPLFKLKRDPRITPVGGLLRRYSLDELPQLVNVLLGTMSLVGPRPPLPSEVATYTRDVRRRLLVTPGITGLWQISGRSDLSWEESVRLDLRYVENWSLALDGLILWKTIRAVFAGDGAY